MNCSTKLSTTAHRPRSLLLAPCILIACVLGSCAPQSNAPSRLPTRASIPDNAPYTLRLHVHVLGESETALSGVSVRAISGDNSITDSTGPTGAVMLKFPYQKRSAVTLELRKDGATWLHTVDNIPVGVSQLRVYLQISSDGSVSFSRMEY